MVSHINSKLFIIPVGAEYNNVENSKTYFGSPCTVLLKSLNFNSPMAGEINMHLVSTDLNDTQTKICYRESECMSQIF